jgi:hypothetical protein
MSAPTPAEVDQKAEQYFVLRAALDDATAQAKLRTIPLVQLKSELVEIVSAYGSCHVEKSKILHGVSAEMVATFGQSVTIDAAAVERFRAGLIESSQTRLLKRVFEQTIRWTLRPEASAIVRGDKLSKALQGLYAEVEVIKPLAPSLTVRRSTAGP